MRRMTRLSLARLAVGLLAAGAGVRAVALVAAPTPAPGQAPTPSSTSIRIDYDVRVPMRDGATLSADIYRPAGDARVPVILVRTPYDNGVATHVAAGKRWAGRGYAYVVQDVRGRGESDGEFYPLVTEGDDGVDTINWLAAQTWATGRVGMMGSSYLGWVQLYAAVRKPAALKALIPTVTPLLLLWDLSRGRR